LIGKNKDQKDLERSRDTEERNHLVAQLGIARSSFWKGQGAKQLMSCAGAGLKVPVLLVQDSQVHPTTLNDPLLQRQESMK
jgi:hypothetical protein